MSLLEELSAIALALAAATSSEGREVLDKIRDSEAFRRLSPESRDWLCDHARATVRRLPDD
jgi:hypothetical protein